MHQGGGPCEIVLFDVLGNGSTNTSPCGEPSDARVAAFANARAAGILPVVASGNDRFERG
jgi:hypothetical protein